MTFKELILLITSPQRPTHEDKGRLQVWVMTANVSISFAGLEGLMDFKVTDLASSFQMFPGVGNCRTDQSCIKPVVSPGGAV